MANESGMMQEANEEALMEQYDEESDVSNLEWRLEWWTIDDAAAAQSREKKQSQWDTACLSAR